MQQGKQGLHPRAVFQGEDALGHFVHRVVLHLLAALRAIGAADARIEQAQVVVDLGGRGHGGAGIARLVLLADGDGRSNAVDQVNIRLFDALQKLPRIGREGFDIAALPLGIDGVKGQRRLSASRDSGDHRQAIVRNFEIDVLQIMNARAANYDCFLGHSENGRPTRLRRSTLRPAICRLPNLTIIVRLTIIRAMGGSKCGNQSISFNTSRTYTHITAMKCQYQAVTSSVMQRRSSESLGPAARQA